MEGDRFHFCSLRTGSQRASEVWKKFGERSEWDAGEPVDTVFNVPFRPLVISLLQICQGGNQTCQNWWVSPRWLTGFL